MNQAPWRAISNSFTPIMCMSCQLVFILLSRKIFSFQFFFFNKSLDFYGGLLNVESLVVLDLWAMVEGGKWDSSGLM